jgi:AcrR family transcriptional regulator
VADSRRGDTRQRIQRVALELFVERGYEKTSLREIAERLGVTKAALYYHFRTKEDILGGIFEDVISSVDELVVWGREQPRTVESRREFLRRYASLVHGRWSLLLRFSRENGPVLRELPIGEQVGSRIRDLFDLVRDPEADVEGQLRAALAFDALHQVNAAIPGIEATEEELREAALAIALDLASSQHRDDGSP